MKTVAVVVEGHGEVQAVPVLVRRIAAELGHGVRVPRSVRIRRNRVDRAGEFERAVELASRDAGETGLILVLLDADRDCPAQLGPALAGRAEAVRPDGVIRVVLAKTEFESCFLAAAASIGGRRGISGSVASPADPEAIRDAKGVLSSWMPSNRSYRPSRDQAALAAVFDLRAARSAPFLRQAVAGRGGVAGSRPVGSTEAAHNLAVARRLRIEGLKWSSRML